MKFFCFFSLLLFSFSSFADDLSFGSFSVEEKAVVTETTNSEIGFASFDVTDKSGRSIASVEEEVSESKMTDLSFGSFE